MKISICYCHPPPEQEIENNSNVDFTLEATTGYRIDLTKIKPAPIEKHNTKRYFSESLKADVSQWEYLAELSGLIMEAIGKFASDNQGSL